MDYFICDKNGVVKARITERVAHKLMENDGTRLHGKFTFACSLAYMPMGKQIELYIYSGDIIILV